MDCFMVRDDSIQNLPALNITRLFRGNDGGENGFQMRGYDFGNDFIDNIGKSDGSEVGRVRRLVRFGDKGKKLGV